MANAQPIRALANYVESLCESDGSKFCGLDEITGNKITYFNARFHPGSIFGNPDFTKNLICEQSFRPHYLELENAGLNVVSEIGNPDNQQNNYCACLILVGKYRAVNERMIDRAHAVTKEGGLIIVAGAKNTGIASLRKRAANKSKIINSVSKFHSVVFEISSTGKMENVVDRSLPTVKTAELAFVTAPGLFSSDKIDTGSKLLLDHFDNEIHGTVADLGSGWGYLSAHLLLRSHKIASLHLYEAEWNGVQLSKQNLADVSKDTKVSFNWCDVTSEAVPRQFDWVIMNPPFHTGHASSTDLGMAFIEKASLILKPGGKLLMVANRHLAYEATLDRFFSSFRILETRVGFKVVSARL